MPQDSLRSVVYRSFVTCDDPKGVVQCGTIRKSKTRPPKMKHKVESQSLASMIEREGMGSKMSSQELHSPSSQLLEVSRGAEKLNQMISSWSGRMSSEDVAKDLLKGALDLQESLVMLGKLQEASKNMARLKKERLRSRSDRFMGQNQNDHGGFQNHRLSVDGPSRDCIDQLREVIRDSFATQNLLQPNTRTEEKACLHQIQRSFGSDLDMASTSSSQSSTDRSHSNRFGSTLSSLSPAAPYKKAKGPSLIARLMGLEEIPSKPVQAMEVKVDSVQETVELKRVLKGDSQNEFRPQSHHFSEARPRCRTVDDVAPIVLIKPMRARSQDFDSLEPTCLEEEALKTKVFLRQLKMKNEQSNKIGSFGEKISNNKVLRKEGTEDNVSRQLDREVGKDSKTKARASSKLKALEPMNQKQQKNEVIDKRVDKVQKVASSSRKPVEKETVKSPSLRSQDQARVTKTRPGKSENGSNIRKLGNPNLISKSTKQHIVHSSSGSKKSQAEKEKAKKKPASAQTTTLSLACQEDKKICPTIEKETIAAFTDPIITTDLESDASDLHSAEKETVATFTDHLITTEDDTDASELHLAEKESIDTVIVHTEEETHASELDSAEKETIPTFTDYLITEEEANSSERLIKEDCIGSASAQCSSTMLNLEHEKDTKTAVEVLDNEGHENIIDCNSLRTRTELEVFLLGNPSFMSHIDDLFDLNISFPLQRQELDINDCEELVLDCANEIVKRRRLPDSRQTNPLLLACTGDARMRLSLDQLIEEVCDGIEFLRSYTNVSSKNIARDNLYATLERDLWSNGVVNGTWDLGWRNGFSVDEAEQVVKDVEKLLFDQLISEAFTY